MISIFVLLLHKNICTLLFIELLRKRPYSLRENIQGSTGSFGKLSTKNKNTSVLVKGNKNCLLFNIKNSEKV